MVITQSSTQTMHNDINSIIINTNSRFVEFLICSFGPFFYFSAVLLCGDEEISKFRARFRHDFGAHGNEVFLASVLCQMAYLP